ncbi:hypothetical protein Tco_0581739 [Tanacetum coccineum]
MDDDFLATAYPKVHENLKLITDERVIDDKPESHSGSMSSMKNLDDTFNFGDQFLHDKPTEDDQEKSKVRKESDSTIPDLSHQTVTSTSPVSPLIVKQSDCDANSQCIKSGKDRSGNEMVPKVLETTQDADLIEKYYCVAWPRVCSKNQNPEKILKEIIKDKKEQDERKQDSTYSIRSTDKL